MSTKNNKFPDEINVGGGFGPSDGFFSRPVNNDPPTQKSNNGRPKKSGLKSKNFTLTLPPEFFEKCKIVAEDKTGGNFSLLVKSALLQYFENENINLDEIELSPTTLDKYRK